MSARRVIALLLLTTLLLSACVTGDTESDKRAEAIRSIARDSGFTEEVATCVVDEVSAQFGLEVLDAADTPDEVSVQISTIMTECQLAGSRPSDAPTTVDGPVPAPSTTASSTTSSLR